MLFIQYVGYNLHGIAQGLKEALEKFFTTPAWYNS
jgi:hypothetical protein